MQAYHLFTLLILITTLLTLINVKFIKLPSSIAVTAMALGLSVVMVSTKNMFPHWNRVLQKLVLSFEFNDVVLDFLLGFLLFSAAFRTNVTQFRQELKVISSLAIISTLLSTFIIGGLVFGTFEIFNHPVPLWHCLVFGALISPTDPLAALGILQRLGISKKLEMQITGESLLNDGISIVLFVTFLNVAVNTNHDNAVADSLLLFAQEAGGALALGFALGGLAILLLRSMNNYKIEILITLSLVMGGSAVSHLLHVSTPLTMVVAGLVCSRSGKKQSSVISHDFVMTFWQLIEEFANVMIFMVMGFELIIIPMNPILLSVSIIFIIVVMVSRYLSILPVYLLLNKHFEKKSSLLLTWGGLRGAVSIALALSLPTALSKGIFLPLTYIIAIFSIVVQGLTIKPLALKLGFGAEPPAETDDEDIEPAML